jgi:hypothetical protein
LIGQWQRPLLLVSAMKLLAGVRQRFIDAVDSSTFILTPEVGQTACQTEEQLNWKA